MIRLDDPMNGLIIGMRDSVTTGNFMAVGASFCHPAVAGLVVLVFTIPPVGIAGSSAAKSGAVRMPVTVVVQIEVRRQGGSPRQ